MFRIQIRVRVIVLQDKPTRSGIHKWSVLLYFHVELLHCRSRGQFLYWKIDKFKIFKLFSNFSRRKSSSWVGNIHLLNKIKPSIIHSHLPKSLTIHKKLFIHFCIFDCQMWIIHGYSIIFLPFCNTFIKKKKKKKNPLSFPESCTEI